MSRRSRRLEALKSVLILLLLLAFVALTLLCWLYDVKTLPVRLQQAAVKVERSLGLYAGDTVTVEGSRAETYGEAVHPTAAAVTCESGRYAALGRESQSARRLYGRLSSLVGEAAGSAGEFVPISRMEWRAALSGESVYFRLSDEISFPLLALELGASRASGPDLHSLLLQPGGETVTLYLASDRGAYRAATSAAAGVLRAVIREFERGDAEGWQPGGVFSFEQGLEGELLTAGPVTLPQVSVSAPNLTEPAFEALLSVFDINPHTNYRYTTAEGLRRAVDVSRVLELSEAGELRYRDSSGEHGILIDTSTLPRLVEQLRRIAAGSIGAHAGDGLISLRSVLVEGDRAVVSFGCTVAGAPIYPDGRDGSGVFVVENGVLTRAEMVLRRYTLESGDLTLLPEGRAQALAGGPCTVAYFDGPAGCEPRWCTGRPEEVVR